MKTSRILLAFVILAWGCSTADTEIPTFEIGQEFTDSNVRVISIDTLSLELSTFKFDSIITNVVDRLLIGQYTDAVFGTTTASAYFEMIPADYNIDNEAVLDSVALILGYDTYFYNDTTAVSQVRVHRLTEEVTPEDEFFYNTSTLPYELIPLAVQNYIPEPFDEDSLHITMPYSFGLRIFNDIKNGFIGDDSELRQEFKGLSLQPGFQDNGAVIGFSVGFEESYLRFFYTIEDEFGTTELTYDLVVNPSVLEEKVFNNISSEGNPLLDQLTDQEIVLSSTESGDQSFIQSGSGIATRITLPSVKSLNDLAGTGTVLSAILQLRSPRSLLNDNLPIRDSLSVNLVDQNNEFQGPLRNNFSPVYGVLNKELSEFNDDFYEIPIAAYLEQKLQEEFNIDDALIIYPLDFTTSVDRLILNGENSEEFEAELIVTYAIYDE